MRYALQWNVARLTADGYSVPRGSHGVGIEERPGVFHMHWLPPQAGGSVPVYEDDLDFDVLPLSIDEELLPPEMRAVLREVVG